MRVVCKQDIALHLQGLLMAATHLISCQQKENIEVFQEGVHLQVPSNVNQLRCSASWLGAGKLQCKATLGH